MQKFKRNISEKLIALMLYRIAQEESSSRLYKSMSVFLDFKGYSGAAKLFAKYSEEELKHAQWAYQYLLDLDILPVVPALEAPRKDFTDLVDIIYTTYEHEQLITEQCEKLAEEAMKENDFMTMHLAQHYLDEQVEELAKSNYWVTRLETFGTDKVILMEIDEEMADKA
jgi:ferritin